MIAASAAAELRSEIGALYLIKLLDLAPGFVADGSGNVDFQSHGRHKIKIFHHRGHRGTRGKPSLFLFSRGKS